MNAISGYPVNDVPARGSMLNGKNTVSPMARTEVLEYGSTTRKRRQSDCRGRYSRDGRMSGGECDHATRGVAA